MAPVEKFISTPRKLARFSPCPIRSIFRRAGKSRPKTGWELAGALCAIGLSVEAVIVAVKSVTPDFDPETTDVEFDPETSE